MSELIVSKTGEVITPTSIFETLGGGGLTSRGAANGDQETPEQGLNWQRYLSAVRRHRWLVSAIIVLGCVGGAIATRYLKQEYTAVATVWIESSGSGKSAPIRAQELLESDAWVQLLTTYAVLDSVILRQKLYLEPKRATDSTAFRDFELRGGFRPGEFTYLVDGTGRGYTLTSPLRGTLERGMVGDTVGLSAGFAWIPPRAAASQGGQLTFRLSAPRDVSRELKNRLTTQINEQRANFMLITLSDFEGARAAATLNAILDQFVRLATDLKTYKLRETSKTLNEQLAQVGEQLRAAEQQLESFKTKVVTEPNEGAPLAAGLQSTQPTVMTRFFSKKLELDEIRRDRAALDRALTIPDSLTNAEAYLVIGSVKNSPDLQKALTDLSSAEAELRALRQKYTDEARPVKTAIDKVDQLRRDVVPRYARSLASALAQQEADVAREIAGASVEIQKIPTRSINEMRLNREVQSLGSIYADVQSRYQAARLAEASAIPDVRILDRAVEPEQPSSSSVGKVLGMTIAASIGLALGLAILLDRLDRRVRYPEQITAELGLTILGVIPRVGGKRSRQNEVIDRNQLLEAFRTVRVSLLGAYGSAGPVVLTITSPNPGDGKSFISANLALSFAEAGFRVALIDGDVRRGELHRVFKQQRVPGLIDHLGGRATIPEIARPTSHERVHLYPSGTRSGRGPELLGSSAMRELVLNLRANYDVIICDCAPLSAGVDPFVLGTIMGNMLVVLRSGESDRQLAAAKLKLIDRLPIRVLGAVLNDISPDDSAGYYQYHYYGDYGATDEAGEPRKLPTGNGGSRVTVGTAT